MSRRRRRPPVSVTLVLPAEPPAREEIDVILMAADAIVGQAGRSGVTLILNGSRSKKALKWEWDRLPDHGALKHLTADQITRQVDWCIHHKWLRLEWVWPRLETINRDIKFLLLDAIGERKRRDLAGVLRAWFPHEVRAVRKGINHALQVLGERTLPQPGRRATAG